MSGQLDMGDTRRQVKVERLEKRMRTVLNALADMQAKVPALAREAEAIADELASVEEGG